MSASKDKSKSTGLLEISVVGPYKMIMTLGSGEFAEVKLAEHMDTGDEVAVKVIEKSRLAADQVQKLYREVKIMKMLNHPNIVQLLEVIDTKKNLYLIMEYVCGGDLYGYLYESGGFSEAEVRTMLRQIVSAVEYCHRKGVVHRDLKIENILLDNELNLKIADFGLSNKFTPGEKLKTICGTLVYSAPEILLGEKYGPEVDVWSLGVILYYLLTGVLPFNDSTSQQLKQEVLRCNYLIPPSLSTESRNLLKKFLVVDPDMRPNLLSIMADKWINHGHENMLEPYVKQQEMSERI